MESHKSRNTGEQDQIVGAGDKVEQDLTNSKTEPAKFTAESMLRQDKSGGGAEQDGAHTGTEQAELGTESRQGTPAQAGRDKVGQADAQSGVNLRQGAEINDTTNLHGGVAGRTGREGTPHHPHNASMTLMGAPD